MTMSTFDYMEKLYLSAVNNKELIKSALKMLDIPVLSLDVQERILDVTVRNEVSKKYPPPVSFQKSFLRVLFDMVEASGSDLSDALMTAYSSVFLMPAKKDISYCSYLINRKHIITLQESSCFVENSTTGLQTWEAAKYLSEWCIRNVSLLKNKSVFELGSGIGLLGLTVLKLCEPSKYIFTDKSWEVLKILSSNIKLNIQDEKENPNIQLHQLVWANVCKEDTVQLSPEIILGADLVYDPSVFESLAYALKIFLESGSSCAYIAANVRNEDTIRKFTNKLGSNGLKYEILKNFQNTIFIYNQKSCFILYKIYI